MRDARLLLAKANAAFRARGGHPVRDVMAQGPQPFSWGVEYPQPEVDDPETGFHWHYHAHTPARAHDWPEHGHFHCFAYTHLINTGTQPIDAPAEPVDPRNRICHLVGVSIDGLGKLSRVFAINRMGAGQWIYETDALLGLIDRFAISPAHGHGDVTQWLAAQMQLARPQIETCLRERDEQLLSGKTGDIITSAAFNPSAIDG